MRIAKPASYLLIVVILGGCAGLRVSQDYEPDTDFSTYGTFAWKSTDQPPSGDIRIDNPLVDGRVREAVERVLNGNRYWESDQVFYDFCYPNRSECDPVRIRQSSLPSMR